MRTPAQQAASRANGARSRGPRTEKGRRRSAVKPFSQDNLAKTTVLKTESRKGFQELVRQHMLCIAPRNSVEQDAVEEIRSTTHASSDHLECLAHACGVLAGKNSHILLQRHETRLQDIIRGSLARVQALRQTGEKRFDETTPVEQTSGAASAVPAGEAHCAPEPQSMRLRTRIQVPRTSARESQKPPPPPSQGEPRKNPPTTHQNPPTTRQNPRTTQRRVPQPGASPSQRWHGLQSLWTAWVTLWHGLEVFIANGFGIWRSVDGGTTWSGLNETLPNLPVRRLLALPRGVRGARLALDHSGLVSEVEWAPGEKTSWKPQPDVSIAAEAARKRALSRSRDRVG